MVSRGGIKGHAFISFGLLNAAVEKTCAFYDFFESTYVLVLLAFIIIIHDITKINFYYFYFMIAKESKNKLYL